MSVDVTVLYFSGCPSWQTAIERVHAAADRTDVAVQVSTQAVETTEDADRLGFTGSPTILLDGTDPFAQPGGISALACRVYATPDGLAGSPTVDQLADALSRCAS
ncbi:thioredoxin family protein [Nostocoides sp. Soil756]|uniref:DF family (seleno)protein n=1 Tax=Nostocoides sp. Soil756 TaxID=1736399 RepID=UPI000A4B1AE7